MPATPGGRQAALRRAADRVETALAGLERPLSQYLLELEPERAEGRSWYAGPGAGELVEWQPILDRAGVRACPNRVAAVYLELAVLVRALEGLATAASLDALARSLVALGRALRPPGHAARLDRRRPPRTGGVRPRIAVVGSINLDLVARCERLPRPGETVTGATFARYPGGKGANQAVACARLGADVTMIGAVGRDLLAEEALAGLREAGVALELADVEEPTGIAMILVDAGGETEIVVAPGANADARRRWSFPSTTPCSVSSRSPTRPSRRRGRRARACSA